MEELGEAIRSWIITSIVVFVVLFGVFIYAGVKEISTTVRSKNIEPGDSFRVECVTENPYDNNVIFGGTVISRHGNYVQYVNFNGDTTSTNIRDVYKYPKTFRVKVDKKQK